MFFAAAGSAQPLDLRLSVRHSRSGELICSHPIQAGDMIRLYWVHSVELTPWEEYYEVRADGALILRTTRFQSYGAGVPEYGGEFVKEKGWMVYRNINSQFEFLNWIHSHTAKFQVSINGAAYLKPEDLPHHEPLKLIIDKETP
jgi:hypothetical protein